MQNLPYETCSMIAKYKSITVFSNTLDPAGFRCVVLQVSHGVTEQLEEQLL